MTTQPTLESTGPFTRLLAVLTLLLNAGLMIVNAVAVGASPTGVGRLEAIAIMCPLIMTIFATMWYAAVYAEARDYPPAHPVALTIGLVLVLLPTAAVLAAMAYEYHTTGQVSIDPRVIPIHHAWYNPIQIACTILGVGFTGKGVWNSRREYLRRLAEKRLSSMFSKT